MGETDKAEDTDVTNDEGHGDPSGSMFEGDFGLDTSGDNVVDNVPLIGNADGIGNAFANMKDGSEISGSLADIGVQIVDFGANAGLLLVDPIGFLVNAAIGLLLDFVQPLEDALGMVTGNPERMAGEIEKWGRVRSAMEPLAEQVKNLGAEKLTGWKGEAATIAKQRLDEFGDAIAAVCGQIAGLEAILECAKALSAVIQDIVKALISEFISARIWTWLAAAASSGPTFGGSIAAWLEITLIHFEVTMLSVALKMAQGAKIFRVILSAMKELKIAVQALGNGFALIKALPGLLGKSETEIRSGSPMSSADITGAMQ